MTDVDADPRIAEDVARVQSTGDFDRLIASALEAKR